MIDQQTMPSGRIITIADAIDRGGRVWIAPREAASPGSGAGTEFNPYRVDGPVEFDQVFLNHGGVGNFILHPGRYYTRGSWAFSDHDWALVMRGSLVGAGGSLATTLTLRDPVLATDGKARTDTNIAWFGEAYKDTPDIIVQGITFDGGAQAPGVTVSGPYVWGSRCLVDDVLVRRIRGNYDTGTEVFVLCVVGASGGSVIKAVRSEAIVPSSYVSGISIGYTGPSVIPSIVTDCHLDGGGGNHFAFAACRSTVIFRSSAHGWKTLLYNDTGPAEGILMADVEGRPEYATLRLVRDGSNPKRMVRLVGVRSFYASQVLRGGGHPAPWIGVALTSAPSASTGVWQEITGLRCALVAPSDSNPFVLASCIEKQPAGPVFTLTESTVPASSKLHVPGASVSLVGNKAPDGHPITGTLAAYEG